ncbi:MAG: hypothetical protein UT24_C0015G0038 [Candidatus Woesebacteria bacterium GW2011_GWB1_39_12]|uniref:Uncharacterized protein n=1 Tax=Candidatus Woesebacteria bacterium GW2011_GWB1_39_12 TaxID=1618574 RepID=A0A0G0PPY8_9BACT|nr:MAG: hypothetical protein UT24_C0015G0038 [Candidatus Woesebacteria bacterium GW2011_GWB1_39_12]
MKEITFQELIELNYALKWLQTLRNFSVLSDSVEDVHGNNLHRRLKEFAGQFELEKIECENPKCILPKCNSDISMNVVFVPTFPGIVALCANCRQQFTFFDGEVIKIEHKPWSSERILLHNDFKNKPGWMQYLTAVWDVENCQYTQVEMVEPLVDVARRFGDLWSIDYLSFDEIKKWQMSPRGAEYWHHNKFPIRFTRSWKEGLR